MKMHDVANSSREEAIALMSSDSQEFIKRSREWKTFISGLLSSSRNGMLLKMKYPSSCIDLIAGRGLL